MRKILLSFLAFLWLVFVLVLYYAGHKPAEPGQFLALLQAVWRLVVVLALTCLAGGIGALILRGESLHPLSRLALQAGLGFGLLGLGVLAVGISIGLPGWLPWAALGFLGVLLHRSIWAWLHGWRGLAPLWRESGSFERILAGLVGIIFLMTLGVALAPPLHFDSLVYHLVMPDAYLRDGRVSYLPWMVMSGMPQTAEMLYTWVIALAGNPAAAVLGWMFGLLSIIGLAGSLRQVFDARAAWVGAAALLAGFTPAWLLAGGYVDWLVFLLSLGALVMLAAWREDGTRRSLVFAALFTGLAVGSKYTSGVLALAALAALAWHSWKRRSAFIPAALTFGGVALLAALPWFIKNTVSTGNPFYPFFLTGGAMTEVRLQVYQHLSAWGNWLDFVFLPVRATYLGFDAGDGYMFAPGALLLGLGGLAWLASRRFETAPAAPGGDQPPFTALRDTAAGLAVGGLLLWALGNQYSGNLIQTRYYFSVFPAFAVLAAAGDFGLRRTRLGPVRMGRLAAALIVLVVGLSTLEVSLAALRNGAPQAALGLKDQEAYLADVLGWFQPAMKAVRDLPPGQRVQLIYEPRSLYCASTCLPDEILDRWKRMWLEQGDHPEAIRAAWRQAGITKLLVNRQGMRFLLEAADPHHPPADLQALDRFLNTLPAPVDFGGVYALYSVE